MLRPCTFLTTGSLFGRWELLRYAGGSGYDRLPQFLRHGLVEFVGVHDCRNNVVLAVNLTGETVRFFVELLGVFVAAVLFKISVCSHQQRVR